MENIKRGNIYYVYKAADQIGSVQQAGRPAIVVSNNAANATSNVIEMVFLTTQPKKELPTHVVISSTKKVSIALCEQVSSISIERIGEYLCSCSPNEMKQVNKALMISLDLNIQEQSEGVSTYLCNMGINQISAGLECIKRSIIEGN